MPHIQSMAGVAIALVLIGAARAFSDTATISFDCGTGRLDFKTSGTGDLVASGGRGVFTGANVTFLSDGSGQAETSGGTVTIHMSDFRPFDVDDSGLSIRITDGSTTVTATVIDFFTDDLPDVLLTDGTDIDLVEFFAPNASNNFMTLVYNATTNVAMVTIQGFGGDTATLTDINMGPIQMGVQAANNQANFGGITFAGPDIPLFPPVFDPANPWVDFGAAPCGNGAPGYPFNLLADAVAAADPGATVSIVPGTDGSETFTGAGAISTALSLENSDPGSGSVRVGVTTRRSSEIKRSTTGFVSRPSP
jgi:hypothetical protein